MRMMCKFRPILYLLLIVSSLMCSLIVCEQLRTGYTKSQTKAKLNRVMSKIAEDVFGNNFCDPVASRCVRNLGVFF